VVRNGLPASGGTPSEESQGTAEVGQVWKCAETEPTVAVPRRGAGNRSRRTRGRAEDGVPRLAAVVAQEHQPGATCAGHGGGRDAGAGDQIEAEGVVGVVRRGGGGDPLAGEESGSPRGFASPLSRGDENGGLAAGNVDGERVRSADGRGADDGAETLATGFAGGHSGGCGQPVGAAGHPDGAGEPGSAGAHQPTGSTGATLGSTGPIGRRPAGAGTAVTSAAAGEDAAGWISGVLGISRSTTGGSSLRAVPGVAGAPQARFAPLSPAPHRAMRRTRLRTRGVRGATSNGICAGAGRAVAVRQDVAVRQARCAPSGPAPHIAARRISAASRVGVSGGFRTPSVGAAGPGAREASP
jgi:hypothetical protein